MMRRHGPTAAILLALPVVTAWVTPVQLFSPPGWVDPGIYLGYFLNLPVLLDRFGPDYSGMRLPWVLSGYFLNAVLPPTLAHFVLMLGTQLLATGSLYAMVRFRYGRPAGFVAVGLFTVNPMWIAAVTRGYVDGPAVALCLACLAVVANRAAFSTRWVPAGLVGVFGSMAFFTHPIAGLVTLLGTVAWLVIQRIGFGDLWRMSAVAGLAGVVLSWIFGAISLAANGPFLFWTVMSDMTQLAIGGFGRSYARPMEAWLPSAYLVFIPFAVLICGLVAIAFPSRGERRSELLKAGCATLGVSLLLYLALAVKSGPSMFQASFYQTLILPGTALILGGLVGEALRVRQASRAGRITLTGCLLAAGLLPLMGAAQIWDFEEHVRADRLLWLFLIGAALVVCVSLWRARAFAVLVLVGALGIAGVADPAVRSVYQVDGNPSYKPMFLAQLRVNEFIRDNVDPKQRVPSFWYNRGDFQQSEAARQWLWYYLWYQDKPIGLTVYDSFSSLWLWDQRELLLGAEMPKMVEPRRNRLLQVLPATVVVFCARPAQCDRGERALELPGHVVRRRAQERIVEPPYLDFTVALVEVDRIGG